MGYETKYDEYTVGYTIIVAYSVGNTNKIHTFSYPKAEVKAVLKSIETWEEHFEEQLEKCNDNGVDYTHSMEVIRNMYYPNTLGFGSLPIEKSELKKLA